MLPNGEAFKYMRLWELLLFKPPQGRTVLRVKTATLTTRKTWTSHNKHRHILQPAHRLHGSRRASIQTHTCAQTQRGRLVKAKAQGLSSDLKVSCMKPSWDGHSSRRRYITDYINCLFLGCLPGHQGSAILCWIRTTQVSSVSHRGPLDVRISAMLSKLSLMTVCSLKKEIKGGGER